MATKNSIYLKLNTKTSLDYGPYSWSETGAIIKVDNNPFLAKEGLLLMFSIHGIITYATEDEYNDYIRGGGGGGGKT